MVTWVDNRAPWWKFILQTYTYSQLSWWRTREGRSSVLTVRGKSQGSVYEQSREAKSVWQRVFLGHWSRHIPLSFNWFFVHPHLSQNPLSCFGCHPGNFHSQSSHFPWPATFSWPAWCLCSHCCYSGSSCKLSGGLFCANYSHAWGLDQLQASLVWSMLLGGGLLEFPIAEPVDKEGYVSLQEQDKNRFLISRIGDHLLCPFQCDTCYFRNIQQWGPISSKSEDIKLLWCIRRANLDALLNKEPNTVSKNFSQATQATGIACSLGITDPFLAMGPFPLYDYFGMKAASVKSLDIGK